MNKKPTSLLSRPTSLKTGTQTVLGAKGTSNSTSNTSTATVRKVSRQNSKTQDGPQTVKGSGCPVTQSVSESGTGGIAKRKAEIEARLAQLRSETRSSTSSTSSLHTPSQAVVTKTVPPLLPFFISLEAFTLKPDDDSTTSDISFTFAIGDSLTVTKETKLIEEEARKQLGFFSALQRVQIPSNATFTITPDNNSKSPRAIISVPQSPKEQYNILIRNLASDISRKIYAGEKGKVLQIFSDLAVPAGPTTVQDSMVPIITLPHAVLLEFIDGAQKYFSLTCIVEYIDAVTASKGHRRSSENTVRVRVGSVPRHPCNISVIEQRLKEMEEKERRRKSEESKYESTVREMMAQPSFRSSWGTSVRGMPSTKDRCEQVFTPIMQWNVPPPPAVIKKGTVKERTVPMPVVSKIVSVEAGDRCHSPPSAVCVSEDNDDSPKPRVHQSEHNKKIEVIHTVPLKATLPLKATVCGDVNDVKPFVKVIHKDPLLDICCQTSKDPMHTSSSNVVDKQEDIERKVIEESPTVAPSQTETTHNNNSNNNNNNNNNSNNKTTTFLCEEPCVGDEGVDVGEPYAPIYVIPEIPDAINENIDDKDSKSTSVPLFPSEGYVKIFDHRP